MPDSGSNIVRKISPGGIPYLDWDGQGPILHFAHANGFPPATYNAFVQHLTGSFHVLGMECRALWETEDPGRFRHWRELGEDLARFLQEMRLPGVIAAGHSMGAVASLYCAATHPELVRALVLIDPVIVPAWFAPLWCVAMLLGLHRRARQAVGARRRRVEWPSREVMLRAYRSAPVFKRWQEPFLRDYVNSATEEDPSGGVHLRYPREWEARVFETPPPDVWLTLPRLRPVPLLVLRGQFSDTYRRETLRWMRWLLPDSAFVEVGGADHFVPMSQPEETAALITQFILSLPEAKRQPGQ